jgi:hypothetical protein
MSNIFIDSYIESLPYKEKIAVEKLISGSLYPKGKTLEDIINLPSISQVNLKRPVVNDVIRSSTINTNHNQVVSYLEEAYQYAQNITEAQEACLYNFNLTMSNVEKSLDQLRMELDAWADNLLNRKDFSDTINLNFMPPLTMSGAGEELLKTTNAFVRSNTELAVKELGPQYRFAAYSPVRITTSIFDIAATGLQVELSIYVEPNQANVIRISPWIKDGAPANIGRILAFGSEGEPILVSSGLVLNKEYQLTFPKSTIQKIVFELYQKNYSINSLPISTPGMTDVEILNKLKESVGESYINSLYEDRFIDWQEVERYLSKRLNLDGYTQALLAQRTGRVQTEENKSSYHLYQLGFNKIEIANQYSDGELKQFTFPLKFKSAPKQVTLRASDWVPNFTSVEYAIKTSSSNSYIPIPNADETSYTNELIYPGKDGVCYLRFPFTMMNSRMPILYEGTRQLNNDEYELINDRQVRLTGTISNNSVFSIQYEIAKKNNIDIPYSSAVSLYTSADGTLGDIFDGTMENDSIVLSKTPFVDSARINEEDYKPVTVNIVGRTAEDITNWFGTKENDFSRIPDKDNPQYKVRRNRIYFDQPIDQQITVIYEHIVSDLDLRVSMKSYSIPPDSPSVSSIQISYLERK